jgi:release factor glutamine methyltransferase
VHTVGDLLDHLSSALVAPDVPPARAQARDLIAWILDKPRFWPSANQQVELDDRTVAAMNLAAEKLRGGMPLQYAVGKAPFRHLTLEVTPDVLIPRPETELIIELVIAAQRGGRGTVVDVGTGSGAIALALAAEAGFEQVIGIDISPAALAVATRNLAAIPEDRRARVEFRAGNLLEPIRGQIVECVVSNPPYISHSEMAELPSGVRDWEPHLALFADDDGMATIRSLVPQAADVLASGGLLALEVDSRRTDLAVDAVNADGRFSDVEPRLDLTGRQRFVVARRKER